MYNGWTQELTEAERATNEVNICLEMVEEQPLNEYWQHRLAAALVHEHELLSPPPVEFALFELRELVYMVPPEPDYTPADWPWTDEDMRDEIMNRYP